MNDKQHVIDAYNGYTEQWAKRLRSGENIAQEYLEKPAMHTKLPDLRGKSVLALGCGSGEECPHLQSLGAAHVTGVDISDGLIANARKSFPGIDFRVIDMERLDFPDASFDFVYSSLVLHYVPDWRPTLAEVKRVLRPGGRFLFSTHHPVKWSAERGRDASGKFTLLGYRKANDEKSCSVFGDYLNAREIDDVWFGDFPITYYHRPLEMTLRDIRESGFEMIDFLEPKPTNAARECDPVFWEIYQCFPMFMIFELRKP